MTVVALAVAMIVGCSQSGNGEGAAAEDREFVHGYGLGECTWPEEQQIVDDDPDIDVYEGILQCRAQMSDPRVSGLEEWTLVDPHYIDYTTNPRTGRFEASVVLTPDTGGGTWRGEGFGADIWSDGGLHTVFHSEFVGEGEYDGLIYRVWGSQQPETGRYEVVGYIQPIE